MVSKERVGVDSRVEVRWWKTFHTAFLGELWRTLVPLVRPSYEVAIEEEVYVEYDPEQPPRRILPDLSVIARRSTRQQAAAVGRPAGAVVALPALHFTEETHRYLEIRRVPDRRLVTVVKLLSPTNKAAGTVGRERYLDKRRDLQPSEVHLVEIDLLLGGERLPMGEPLPAGDFYVLVSRWERRPLAEVLAFSLGEPIPALPVPLLGTDEEAIVDLEAAYRRVHADGDFDAILAG